MSDLLAEIHSVPKPLLVSSTNRLDIRLLALTSPMVLAPSDTVMITASLLCVLKSLPCPWPDKRPSSSILNWIGPGAFWTVKFSGNMSFCSVHVGLCYSTHGRHLGLWNCCLGWGWVNRSTSHLGTSLGASPTRAVCTRLSAPNTSGWPITGLSALRLNPISTSPQVITTWPSQGTREPLICGFNCILKLTLSIKMPVIYRWKIVCSEASGLSVHVYIHLREICKGQKSLALDVWIKMSSRGVCLQLYSPPHSRFSSGCNILQVWDHGRSHDFWFTCISVHLKEEVLQEWQV